MAKIVVEIISSHGARRDLRVFDQDAVWIGRGYNNDLILQDPYVSAGHLVIRLSPEGGMVVEDLDSRNGVFLGGAASRPYAKEKVSGHARLTSGDKVFLGNTVLRVFHPSHAVHPSKLMPGHKRAMFSVDRLSTFLLACFVAFFLYFLDAVVRNTQETFSWGGTLLVQFVSILAMMFWSGMWSLVGFLIQHRARFRAHLTTDFLFGISLILIVNLSGNIGFIFASPLAEIAVMALLLMAAVSMMLFGHFTLATRTGFRGRVIASILIPCVIYALICLGYMAYWGEFSPEPPYYPRLKPLPVQPFQVHKIDDVGNFMDDVYKDAEAERKNQN